MQSVTSVELVVLTSDPEMLSHVPFDALQPGSYLSWVVLLVFLTYFKKKLKNCISLYPFIQSMH